MTTSNLEAQYQKIYNNKILPRAQALEKSRKEKLNQGIIISAIILVIGVIASLFVFSSYDQGTTVSLIATGVIILVFWGIYNDRFVSQFKKEFQNHILSIFGKFNISDQSLINLSELALLYPQSTHKNVDDKIVGSHKDVAVVIEESRCYKEEYYYRDGKRQRREVNTFKGVLVKLSMNKNNTSITVLKRKELLNSTPAGLEKIMLEDPEFQKIYATFSNDQIEARYILTTAFMQRLKDISLAFAKKNPDVICRDNYILLAIPTDKNLFEVGNLFKTLVDENLYKDMFNQMVAIIQMIEQLKLDQKTGL